MTAYAGQNGYFSFDNKAGSPVNYTSYVTNVESPFESDLLETTTFGQPAVTRITGLKDRKLSVQMVFDATADRTLTPMLGQIGTYAWGPRGNTSVYPRITGEALVVGLNLSDPHEGLITVDMELEIDNTATRDTF